MRQHLDSYLSQLADGGEFSGSVLVVKKGEVITPGTSQSYSNSGYVLLALVIEKITGKPYGQYVQEAILTPLGMKSSGHYQNQAVPGLAVAYLPALGTPGKSEPVEFDDMHWSDFVGSGSIYSTTHDLYRLDRALNSNTFISSESKMLLGNALLSFGHAPGRSSGFLRYPQHDVCIVVLGNMDPSVEAVCTDLAELTLKGDGAPLDPGLRRSCQGEYARLGGSAIRITEERGKLFIEAAGLPKRELTIIENGDFLMDGLVYGFLQDSDGRVTGMVARDIQEGGNAKVVATKIK